MITLDENTYVLGYWFASDGKNNWYLIMIKQKGEWIGQQTFRYNKDDSDPFMDKDEKSIRTIRPQASLSEDEIIKKIDLLFDFIKLKYNDEHDRFIVKGDAHKFMKIAKTKHYLHMKMVH
jgi:hypothetical protein